MSESSLKTAVTVTSWFVTSAMSAEAVGLTGAVLSILFTVKLVTAEIFPAASVPRKNIVPLSANSMLPVYDCHFVPFRLYSRTMESLLKTAVTVTS